MIPRYRYACVDLLHQSPVCGFLMSFIHFIPFVSLMQLESMLYNCTSAFFKVTYCFVFHFRAVYTHCHISMITQPAICSFDVCFLDCVGVVQRIITLIRCCVNYVMSQTVRNLVFDDDDEQ